MLWVVNKNETTIFFPLDFLLFVKVKQNTCDHTENVKVLVTKLKIQNIFMIAANLEELLVTEMNYVNLITTVVNKRVKYMILKST